MYFTHTAVLLKSIFAYFLLGSQNCAQQNYTEQDLFCAEGPILVERIDKSNFSEYSYFLLLSFVCESKNLD